MKKGVFTKTNGSMAFEAVWVGERDGCDQVHVTKVYNYSRTKTQKIEKDVLVCNGKVTMMGETPLDRPLKNKQVSAEVRRVARLAQRYGAASGEVNNYIIEAFPLRDFEKCTVEVRIFNKNNGMLIERFRVNGCR
jgi:hypothetical protein